MFSIFSRGTKSEERLKKNVSFGWGAPRTIVYHPPSIFSHTAEKLPLFRNTGTLEFPQAGG